MRRCLGDCQDPHKNRNRKLTSRDIRENVKSETAVFIKLALIIWNACIGRCAFDTQLNIYHFPWCHLLLFFFVSGASHSALGDMKTITQETSSKTITAAEPRARDVDIERDLFVGLDEFYAVYANSTSKSSRGEDVVVVAEPEPPKRLISSTRNVKNDAKASFTAEGEAQKKFGSAKAISSEQYFQDSASDNSVSKPYEKRSYIEIFYFIAIYRCSDAVPRYFQIQVRFCTV